MKHRAFLKWPGGKYRVLERILAQLPDGSRLIEPFVGSGVVFLNTHYDSYLLSDINQDIISLYNILKTQEHDFITQCQTLFTQKNNTEKQYYSFRKKFNQLDFSPERAALFLYLNRHGYNGLCRYNQKGEYNVPFGRYKKPYFPEAEMHFFAQKSKRARFICESFEKTLSRARQKQVVYCDPPYIPLSKTAYFTSYQPGQFGLTEQVKLAQMAAGLSNKKIPVLISNHDTAFAQQIYQSAQIKSFFVQRFISCSAKRRKPVKELLALFQ